MAAEQDWREKYREALGRLAREDERWARTQNVLKLLIGRLCLAAQGRDDGLDHQIARVSDSVRKQIDIDTLEGILAPLSAAVATLDAQESTAASSSSASGNRLGFRPSPGAGEGAKSSETTQPNATIKAPPSAVDATANLRGVVTAPADSTAIRKGTAVVGRESSPASAPTHSDAPTANDAAARSAATPPAPSSTEPPTEGSAQSAPNEGVGNGSAERTQGDDALGATAVLDRLALLPELKPVVNDLRSRKRDTLNIHEMAELLERVTRYATEQRAQVQREKLELEKLVQQTASRLEEITSHLTSELDERNSVQQDTELLNKTITDEVEQIRLTAAGAPDVQTLRTQLSARLDAISNHFTDFRAREDSRIRTYRERVQHMRSRISVLERESRSLQESLREEQRLAMIDALTGIPNRAAYDDRIEQEFKRWKRFTRPVSILAWDIDRFKSINDAYGHKAGDKVLRVIGQHLARHVRDTDFVARYGGEEFVMLLVGTGVEEARVVADKIRVELAQLGFHFHDSPVAVTASCGITEFTGTDTPDIIFDRADRALYKAKQAGRNCCVVG
jgi:diguanylate cyclase